MPIKCTKFEFRLELCLHPIGELTALPPKTSGGATPGRARSRSTALAQALAPPCLALRIALLW